MTTLLPCPFCGGEAEFERMGTRRQSCVVSCTMCGCWHESGDQDGRCGSSWNSRHRAQSSEPAMSEAGWRPIETAPLSPDIGLPVYILLWNGFHVGVGFRRRPNYPDDPEFCDETGEFIEPQPTHWMPLPPPPAPHGE